MSSQTREAVEKAAYAAVGAPVAALKALGARISEFRDALESSRKEMSDELEGEINEWIIEGERVIERAMEKMRSTRESGDIGAWKATRAVEEGLDVTVPDTELTVINGVGPTYARKLARAGVPGVADFISVTGTKEDVSKLAELTGFSSGTIESWRDQVDLSRVSGIGGEQQWLLHRADVWTVKTLSDSDPAELIERFGGVDELVSKERTPSIYQVKQWVAEAGRLINSG